MTCARRILGAPQKTAHDAMLVRLGWMPLDYLMMYRCIILCIKSKRGLAGPAMQRLYADVESYTVRDPRLSRFFSPSVGQFKSIS